MVRRTLRVSKPAAKAMVSGGQFSQTLKAGQVVVGGALARLKGTVMEAMAKSMPEKDRKFFAERWGFAGSTAQGIDLPKNVLESLAAVGATTAKSSAASDLANDDPSAAEAVPVQLTEGEQMLARARAAGAAARRAMEAGGAVPISNHSVRINGTASFVNGEQTQATQRAGAGAGLRHHSQNGTGMAAAHEAIKASGGVPFSQATAHQAPKAEEQALAAREEAVHPILGQLVADLRYKRVYRTSIASLVKAPVWEKQRILRPERAMAIAEAKLKKKNFNGIPGVITLFELTAAMEGTATADGKLNQPEHDEDEAPESSTRLGIVDGQHRVGALMLMAERGGWDSAERNIMVDVFDASSERDVAELFTEINRAEPVRLVDMPEEGATAPVKEVLNTAVESLRTAYPAMFKTSARCRLPHVNVDNLRDDIFQSGLTERHCLKTPEDLHRWLLKVNAMLGRRSDDQWSEISKGYKGMSPEAIAKALTKAKEKDFYLGMDKSWLMV